MSVLDKGGKLVTELQQTLFKVFENGVEQPIKIFRREDVPISLGIIIDNSGSMWIQAASPFIPKVRPTWKP